MARIAALIALLALGACAPTAPEKWRGGDYALAPWEIRYYPEHGAKLAHFARRKELYERAGHSPAFAKLLAAHQSAPTLAWADMEAKVIHTPLPQDEMDAYAFCALGHEIFHATHGAFHAEPVMSCEIYRKEGQ